MLFQSTHEELQGAEALAEQGERIFKSPLKRTLSAQIMVGPSTMGLWIRETILFIERSIMISNATNPLKESRKESLLGCAGCTSICVWLVCDLFVIVCKLLVTVP